MSHMSSDGPKQRRHSRPCDECGKVLGAHTSRELDGALAEHYAEAHEDADVHMTHAVVPDA